MKRVCAICIAAVMIIAIFTGCGASKSVDLNTLLEEINSTYGLTDLKPIEDTDGLHRYYQIETDGVKQFAAEHTTAATVYSEVILIEAVDQDAAANIKAKLDEHLRSQLSDARSYSAEHVGMLEACSVKESGSYVYLIIGDNHEGIENTVAQALQ